MADYKISGERLKGFADQARRLGEVTGELTPEQIEGTLSGVEAGGGKPTFESMLTDKIENHIVSVFEFVPGGRLEDTTPPPEPGTYYNGVKLPEIPADGIAEYPYAWIRKNTTSGYYDLLLSKKSCYCLNNGIYGGESDYDLWYRTPISAPERWEQQSHTFESWGLDTARSVLWSNHDIPNGSATATDIYFKGSEPVIVE